MGCPLKPQSLYGARWLCQKRAFRIRKKPFLLSWPLSTRVRLYSSTSKKSHCRLWQWPWRSEDGGRGWLPAGVQGRSIEAPTPAAYTSHTPHVPHEIEALFEDIAGKELSDKLGNTPIADLTKAFGFNDRLLTQNELFGGNKAVADEVIKDLNNMSGFESAKGFLLSLATKYNWAANEDRKKQAKTFIKLVRRRFR